MGRVGVQFMVELLHLIVQIDLLQDLGNYFFEFVLGLEEGVGVGKRLGFIRL